MDVVLISLRVSHDLTGFAATLSAYPERVERALSAATSEATRHTERFFGEEMVSRARGKYWDIDADVTPTPGGARGRVSTEKNRSHRIEPTKPHGLLVFEIDGRTVFVKGGVNHPGSRPVDVLSPLRRTEVPRLKSIYTSHVRRAFSGAPSSAMPAGVL